MTAPIILMEPMPFAFQECLAERVLRRVEEVCRENLFRQTEKFRELVHCYAAAHAYLEERVESHVNAKLPQWKPKLGTYEGDDLVAVIDAS